MISIFITGGTFDELLTRVGKSELLTVGFPISVAHHVSGHVEPKDWRNYLDNYGLDPIQNS